jgi:hypothetical protein
MAIITQERKLKGSQRWLQELVNVYPHRLKRAIHGEIGLGVDDNLIWLSPLEEDSYAEYQDSHFLERLSIRLDNYPLASFWPRGGPVWDGMGKSSRGDVFLIEAKSHVSELVSSCQAGERARKVIERSLEETAAFYGVGSADGWSNVYYQYANRLAHLHLLRGLNGIPAWLVFVYFVNDAQMSGPTSVSEWQRAIESVHEHLGIDGERLRPIVIDLFFDVAPKEMLKN